jgi:hypothetical protein
VALRATALGGTRIAANRWSTGGDGKEVGEPREHDKASATSEPKQRGFHLEWVETLSTFPRATLLARPHAIAKVAPHNGIELRNDEDFASLYLRTENELLRKQGAQPSSGLSCGPDRLDLPVVIHVMPVLLHDRIRNVFRDPKLGHGEPWLILDAEGGLARILAQMWMLALFMGPWPLAVFAIRGASLGIRSDGSVSYLVFDSHVSGSSPAGCRYPVSCP